MQVGELFAKITLDIKGFAKNLSQAHQVAKDTGKLIQESLTEGPQKALIELEKQTKQMTKNINSYFKNMVSGVIVSEAIYSAINAIKNATSSVFQFYQTVEDAQLAFKTMLGSETEARKFVSALKEFAAETPFRFEDVEEAAKKFKAFNFETKKIIPTLRIIGDAVAAVGGGADVLHGVITAIGQIRTKGRAQAEELLQLAERGIPAYQILQEELGLTAEQVANIGELSIDADRAINALLKGMDKRFGGLMKEISNNTSGMISSIKDNFQFIAQDLFAGALDSLKNTIRVIRDFTSEVRKVLNTGGIGALFERLIPPETQSIIRIIVGSLQSLWESLKRIIEASMPVVKAIGKALVSALAVVLPLLAALANVLSSLALWLTSNKPLVEALVVAIIGLKVAQMAAIGVARLTVAIRALSISSIVAKAVDLLRKSIQLLTMTMARNPIILIVSLVSAGLLSLALSSKNASQWIDHLMKKLGQLAGFNVDDILQPTDPEEVNKYLSEYNKALSDSSASMEDISDNTDKAKKANEKWLASFDEVYQVPEQLDEVGDKIGEAGKLPDLPEMPSPDSGKDIDLGSSITMPDLPDTIMLPEIKWMPPGPGAAAEVFEEALARIKAVFEEFRVLVLEGVPALKTIEVLLKVPANWKQMLEELKNGLQGIPALKTVEILLKFPTNWRESLGEFKGSLQGIPSLKNIDITFKFPPSWQEELATAKKLIQEIPSIKAVELAVAFATDWKSVFDTAKQDLQSIPSMKEIALKLALSDADWQTIIAKVKDKYLSSIPSLKTVEIVISIANNWQEIVQGVKTALDSIKDKTIELGLKFAANWQSVLEEAKKYLSGIPSTYLIVLALQIAINWEAIKAKILANLNGIKTEVLTAWENIKTTVAEKLEQFQESVVTFWEEHKTTILLTVAAIIAGIVLLWAGLPALVGAALAGLALAIIPKWDEADAATNEKVEGIKTNVSDKFQELVDDVVGKHVELKDDVTQKWGDIKKDVEEKNQNIEEDTTSKWENIKKDVIGKAKDIWSEVTKKWEEIKENSSETWKNIKIDTSGKWTDTWEAIKDTASKAWENYISTPFSSIWSSIKTWFTNLKTNAETWSKEKWSAIKSITSTVWSDYLSTPFQSIFDNVKKWFGNLKSNAETWIKDKWTAIKNIVNSAWSTYLSSPFNSVWTSISTWFKDLIEDAKQWGRDVVEGLGKGIRDKVEWIKSEMESFAGNVASAFKNFFGIHSPSTLMAEYGNNIAQGLAGGMRSGESLSTVTSAAETLASSVKGPISGLESFARQTASNIVSTLRAAAQEINSFTGAVRVENGNTYEQRSDGSWVQTGTSNGGNSNGGNNNSNDDQISEAERQRQEYIRRAQAIMEDIEKSYPISIDTRFDQIDAAIQFIDDYNAGKFKNVAPMTLQYMRKNLGLDIKYSEFDMAKQILNEMKEAKRLYELAGSIPGLATGGTVTRSGLTMVGEEGPELLNLQRGAQVVSNPNLRIDIDYDKLAQALSRYLHTILSSSEKQPLYVGTLIADERSLKELERRMRVIRMREMERGGLT